MVGAAAGEPSLTYESLRISIRGYFSTGDSSMPGSCRPTRLSVIGVFLCLMLSTVVQAASISFQHPANGATISGPGDVELRLTIDDPDNEIRSVEYRVAGIRRPAQGILVSSVPIGKSFQEPFTFVWPSVYGPTRKVTAEARNAAGVILADAVTQFNIGGSQAIVPTISLVTPEDNDVFSLGQVFEFRATANAFHGVSCVEFQEPAIVTPTVSPPITITSVCAPPYRVNWSSPLRREMRVQARVLDRLGNYADSNVADITIGNQRPTVAIESPANNSPVIPGATVTISATANDLDGNLRYVEFRSGPTPLSVLYGRDEVAPYTVDVTAQQGGMTVYARAYDSYDLESLYSSVTLVEAIPPTVTIASPVPNTTLPAPASVAYEAIATTTSGTVAKVELFEGTEQTGGRLLGQASNIPGSDRFAFTWSNIPVGVYPVRAKATSTTGAWALSAYSYLFVNAPNQPPTITLTSPSTGASYPLSAALTLRAVATDVDGTVERVDFYNDSSPTAIASVPRVAAIGETFETNWSAPAVGPYAITAKAFDNNGTTSIVSNTAIVSVTTPVVTETIHFYHSDAQGSIVAVSDAAGQRVASTSYRPFGQVAAGTGQGSPTRLGFTGKLRDTDLELIYSGARFYDPIHGRFIGLDPVDFHSSDLQSFGRYAYANNNPYRFVDPDGRQSRDVEWEFRMSGADRSRQDGINLPAWMLVEVLCGFCDLNYRTPPGSGELQPVAAPWEVVTPSRAMFGSLGARGAAALAANNFSRVGRWMSRTEYQAMKTTRVVQADSSGMHRVAYPATPDAYKAAPKGDIYVEYDVPTSSLSPGGTEAWRTIHGPGSPAARLAEKKGLPIPQLPSFKNLSEPLQIK